MSNVQKTVYFVRHGQTELNKKWVHQYPETRLSTEGEQQARAVAGMFKDISVDLIVSSPYDRTRQTAEAIRTTTGAPVEHSDLFVELRRPRALWGMSWAHPRSLWIMGQLYLRAGKQNWHYSDEENLEEFHARARRALEQLADRTEKNIVVVTHRGLMANLFERIRGDGMDSIKQYRRALWKNLAIGNCCYQKAIWNPQGTYGETLDGTWQLEGGTVCPE